MVYILGTCILAPKINRSNFNAIFQIQKYFGVKIQIFEQYFLAVKFEILQKLRLAGKNCSVIPNVQMVQRK